MPFWRLDPSIDFLNHGSFGATPEPVLEEQRRWRDLMEKEPVRFFVDLLEPAIDKARVRLCEFIGAAPQETVFVHNATTAVNTVLRWLEPRLKPGDQLLTTDHVYNACLNAMNAVAKRTGAEVVIAKLPFPLLRHEQVSEVVLAAVTPRTRWALLDHVTSPSALVFPIEGLIGALKSRGVQVMIDGAHAPGMLPLQLQALNADWYTGNLHKWCCSPKGAAFLWVSDELTDGLQPLVISHGANLERTDRSRFHLEFDYGGTEDVSSYLSVPSALDAIASLEPGGWPEVMKKNHALALEAGGVLLSELGLQPFAPDSMRGSMYAVELPGLSKQKAQALSDHLIREQRFEVPVMAVDGRVLLRVSAQRYNRIEQYQRLASVVRTFLQRT
ncbi:MAG: aminotransferase class V-fold PLP-dependent enzyme [Myxococcaceae bacterium]